MPLAEVVVDFFDQLKSRGQGYASLDYEPAGYRRSALVKVDLLLNAVPADAFATIVRNDKAFDYGRRMTEKLKELIPRQLFDVPIQAAIGGRIIAETVRAKRKDVLAKCYGGDITQAQAAREAEEGKKKMKSIGRVEVPGDVFVNAPQARRLTPAWRGLPGLGKPGRPAVRRHWATDRTCGQDSTAASGAVAALPDARRR